MFAGLLDKLNDVQTVKVTGGAETVTLKRADGGKWHARGARRLPGRRQAGARGGARPCQPEAGRGQDRRRRPLPAPRPRRPGQAGRESRARSTLLDKDGKQLAAAVVGKTKFGLYGGGRSGVYVRRAGEQPGLARRRPARPADRADGHRSRTRSSTSRARTSPGSRSAPTGRARSSSPRPTRRPRPTTSRRRSRRGARSTTTRRSGW